MTLPAQNITIDDLAAYYQDTKREVEKARKTMQEAENALLEALTIKEEGSSTEETERFKITTTGRVNRTVNEDALRTIAAEVPEAILSQAIRFKPAVDKRGLDYLKNNEPAYAELISKAIIAKPGKPSVKVEQLY